MLTHEEFSFNSPETSYEFPNSGSVPNLRLVHANSNVAYVCENMEKNAYGGYYVIFYHKFHFKFVHSEIMCYA